MPNNVNVPDPLNEAGNWEKIGFTIDGQEVPVKLIGHGGYSKVYIFNYHGIAKVIKVTSHNAAALKTVDDKLSPAAAANLVTDHELNVSASLDVMDPYIREHYVTVSDSLDGMTLSAPDAKVTVMEYVEGVDLHEFAAQELAARGPQIVSAFDKLTQVISHQHANGIFNYDVVGNVRFDGETIRILDYNQFVIATPQGDGYEYKLPPGILGDGKTAYAHPALIASASEPRYESFFQNIDTLTTIENFSVAAWLFQTLTGTYHFQVGGVARSKSGLNPMAMIGASLRHPQTVISYQDFRASLETTGGISAFQDDIEGKNEAQIFMVYQKFVDLLTPDPVEDPNQKYVRGMPPQILPIKPITDDDLQELMSLFA